MPVPYWAGHYIGLPFKGHGRDRSGLDCWGLVRLVMAEQFGLALPSFCQEYGRTTDTQRIPQLIARESTTWREVTADGEELGDIVVLRMRGKPMHVGMVLGDSQMLHIEQGIDSAIEKYRGARWQDRIAGFYRYKNDLQELEYDDDGKDDIFSF
jgi:cell wall-associated NlpC family hydrolase